jgi:hypothetical protein
VHLFLQAAGVHYVRDGIRTKLAAIWCQHAIWSARDVGEDEADASQRPRSLVYIYEQQKRWEIRKRLMLFPEIISRT